MLHIPATIEEQIRRHGASAYPEEGCGLLLGEAQPGHNRVAAIVPAANRWPVAAERPVRFQIAAEDMLRAELVAAEQGLDVIGVFHSHPDDRPIASPRDLAWATWPGYSYLITEVRQGEPGQSRSWQLKPDRSGFDEEEVVIDTIKLAPAPLAAPPGQE
jgi:proteasome lid subunit RPN8/RPN11